MKRLSIFAAPLILSGCYTPSAADLAAAKAERDTPPAPVPTCVTDAECSAKWAAARTFVLDTAGYKMQTYFPDFLETYNSVGYSVDLAAQVNKAPNPAGGYFIRENFWCSNLISCTPNAAKTLNRFNATLNAVDTK